MIYTYKSQTPPEILGILGARLRDYRMRLNMTRKQLSEAAGVGMTTLYKLETGNMADISFSVLLKLMRSLGIEEGWDKMIPELPESPYLYDDNLKKKQRVRHPKS